MGQTLDLDGDRASNRTGCGYKRPAVGRRGYRRLHGLVAERGHRRCAGSTDAWGWTDGRRSDGDGRVAHRPTTGSGKRRWPSLGDRSALHVTNLSFQCGACRRASPTAGDCTTTRGPVADVGVDSGLCQNPPVECPLCSGLFLWLYVCSGSNSVVLPSAIQPTCVQECVRNADRYRQRRTRRRSSCLVELDLAPTHPHAPATHRRANAVRGALRGCLQQARPPHLHALRDLVACFLRIA